MIFNKNKVKGKVIHLVKGPDGSRSLVRETRIVLLLVFVLFFFAIIYILYMSDDSPLKRDRDNTNNQQIGRGAGVPYTTPRELPWVIELPENYSIKDNDNFETEYFGIYYNNLTKRYYVNIYKGEEYKYEEIKLFIIDEVILKVKDFEEYGKFPNGAITFIDRRGRENEEFDFKTFEANP
jgi:hypothetical protein